MFWIEVVLLLAMIVANGALAMAEISLVSARRARLQQQADEGSGGARAALALMANPNQFLSTVQIGITLVGILAGAFGGATIARELTPLLAGIPVVGAYADAISVGLVVVVTTYLSLVIGELTPKRIGLNNAERIASVVAGPMVWLSRLAGPVVRVLTVSTDTVVRVLGVRPSEEPPVTEEEIAILIEQGARAGVLWRDEQVLISRVLRLDDRRVSMVMTPRPEVVWLDLEEALDANLQTMAASGYSYFPVGRGNLDETLGVVSIKQLWRLSSQGGAVRLEDLLTPAVFIPEGASLLSLLSLFRETGQHMIIVISEYGGVEGVVTADDVLEAVVGEVASPDAVMDEPEIVPRTDGSWLVDGLLPLDVFRSYFALKGAEVDEERGMYETVGGLVMAELGQIPQVADGFEWRGLQFEVMDMDGRRVDKVLVRRVDGAAVTPDD